MENETQNQENKTEENQQNATKETPIQEGNRILLELKEQNKIMQDNIKQMQEMQSEAILSGRGIAGQVPREKTEGEKITDGAKKMLEGSGFEDMFDDNS